MGGRLTLGRLAPKLTFSIRVKFDHEATRFQWYANIAIAKDKPR
jgi:hypothetical protein